MIMNNRWRQTLKEFRKYNLEIQKSYGIKHRCLSKTERKRIKKGIRYLRKFEIKFDFGEFE